jgi:hypothetical protein
MVKRVFSGDMVFHAWASQNVDYGKRSDDRVQFNGRAIYSYGRHYMLGYIMPNNVVLLNNYKHSVSTGQHMSSTRAATRHMRQYFLPHLEDLINSAFRIEDFAARENMDAQERGIVAYLDRNWNSIPDDTGEYLFQHCGKKPAAWHKFKANKIREQAKNAAALAKQTLENDIRKAKGYAAERFEIFANDVANKAASTSTRYMKRPGDSYKRWHEPTPSENLDEYRAIFRKLLKVARANPRRVGKSVIAELERRARFVRDFGKQKDATADKFKRLIEWQNMKREFRNVLAVVASEAITYQSVRSATSALDWLVGKSPIAFDARKLSATRMWIQERDDARIARETERQRLADIEREKRNARLAAEREAAKLAWLAGDTSAQPGRFSDEQGRACLRVVGDELQTSWGVQVPLAHAVKVFRMVKLCRENKREWTRNGSTIRVGHFHVDHIYPNGNFQAGCHEIGWNEVERVAKLAGLFDLPAENTTESSH